MRKWLIKFGLYFRAAIGMSLLLSHCALAQNRPPEQPDAQSPSAPTPTPSSNDPSSDPGEDEIPALFPHFESDRFWLSGQANLITQWHPAFYSPYQGPN